ncbi:MAG: phosphate acyltransferase [Acidobacteriota bacterium]
MTSATDPHPAAADPADPPTLLGRLRRRAAGLDALVALPEATDPRVLEAAMEALRLRLCRPILVGAADAVAAAASAAGLDLPGEIAVRDPLADPRLAAWTEALVASCAARDIPTEGLAELAASPLGYADLLVLHGEADAAVMGAVATTADTLRAALRVVGVDARYEVVTSCFLMELPDGRVLVYADCGVVPQPTPAQLADIAVQAAEARRRLVGDEPVVALLAFATAGSARHESLEPVRAAVEILRTRKVDFVFDGELQGDAALVPAVAQRKAPASPVAGAANVLIFPDLNSGNIAYKLTERLAGARAVGPLLQGLARPVHDLSRGCSVDDVLDAMMIGALDARAVPRRNP